MLSIVIFYLEQKKENKDHCGRGTEKKRMWDFQFFWTILKLSHVHLYVVQFFQSPWMQVMKWCTPRNRLKFGVENISKNLWTNISKNVWIHKEPVIGDKANVEGEKNEKFLVL